MLVEGVRGHRLTTGITSTGPDRADDQLSPTVTFSDMWMKCSCLLSPGADLDYMVTSSFSHTKTHKHTLFKTACGPYHEPCSLWSLLGGGGDCQTGWAGSSWSRPLCPRLSFSVHLHWLPTCLFSQRALWKDRNVMLLLKHNLWWSLYAVPMLYLQSMSTPSTHPPNASSQRLQAPGSV